MVRRDLIRNIIILLLAILVVILLRVFVFSTFKITSETDNSYLKKGDLVTVATRRTPLVKDFVVYKVKGKEYLGRIVAKSGQEVTSMDDVLYINHKINHESYLKDEKTAFVKQAQPGQYFTDDFTTQTISHKASVSKIPKDAYLILNDNRQNKNDSRKFGFIKKEQIKGVVSFRVWPLSDFGFVTVE
ncbi:signal peptidase I [Streptococcus dentasini]